MRIVTTLLLVLTFAGCASPSRTVRLHPEDARRIPSYSPWPELKRQIDELLPDSLFPPSNAGIRIVSLSSGQTLYDLNPDLCFIPGSNQKLFTSATALHELGPDYRFTTRVFADTVSSPVITLRGAGDPLLATHDMDSLAALVAGRLPGGRIWTLAGDTSWFDDLDRGSGWCWDDEPDPTAMFISPLSLNGNAIRVLVRPGRRPGDSARVATDPPTGFVTVENSATTRADALPGSIKISRRWREHSNTMTVAGEIRPADSLVSKHISIAQPEWYALTVLRERLESRGVRCGGMILDTIPQGSWEVANLSHRLDSVLTYMNIVSDNLSAENVLKTLGAEKRGGPGSAAAGAGVLRSFLSGMGIDTSRIIIADGSGVSRYNLTTASAIVSLLVGMRAYREIFPLWYSTFPVAGLDGTLSRRLSGTPAEGNLHAKTGTLSGVASLSGYVATADGDTLAFSMVMEHFPFRARPYRDVQDRLCSFLASLRKNSY